MSLQLLPYVAPLFGAALLSVVLMALAYPQRTIPGVKWFLVFAAGLVVWSLAYAFEIVMPGLEAKVLTAKIQYLGITCVPVAWLAFATEYAGVTRWSRWTVAGVFSVPLVTVLVAWTNEVHGMLWSEITLATGRPYTVLALEYGLWFWAYLGFSYVCLLVATGLLIRVVVVRPPIFRRQATLLFVACLFPWFGNLLYVTGLNPTGLDLTVFGFLFSAVVAGWAMLRWKLLSIGPIGRDTIVEGMSEPVAVIDPDGRLVDVNPAAATLLRAEESELVGRSAGDALAAIAPDLDPARATRRRVRGLADGRSYDVQVDPLRDAKGRMRGWTLVLHDVTERVAEAEALEKARAFLERTAAAQRAFLANMNHELRTPLNGVLGMLEVLLASDLDPEQRHRAKLALASGEELLALLNRILEFSEVVTDDIKLQEAEFDIAGVARDVLTNMRSRADAKRVTLTLDIQPDVPERVLGDGPRLRQVLTSLISNAVKFTNRGDVSLSMRLVSQDEAEAWVRVEVADNGIGIPRERLDEIFGGFVQGDGSPTRVHDGVGLGLALAHRLVATMGGELEVESSLGHGARFFFVIPLRPVSGLVGI